MTQKLLSERWPPISWHLWATSVRLGVLHAQPQGDDLVPAASAEYETILCPGTESDSLLSVQYSHSLIYSAWATFTQRLQVLEATVFDLVDTSQREDCQCAQALSLFSFLAALESLVVHLDKQCNSEMRSLIFKLLFHFAETKVHMTLDCREKEIPAKYPQGLFPAFQVSFIH